MSLELGLDTFGDITRKADGKLHSHDAVLRQVLEEGVLADELGVDFFGIGEHHREDFAVSSPETLLAGIATRTKRIKLGSSVTVLSSDDPIRVYQRFATVDALSNGRAEVTLGRGSFTESFPLFGFDLSQYETLFEEKLEIFARLSKQPEVSWDGSHRTPLKKQKVYPPTASGKLKTWVGVGGSPESVLRAASHDLPLMLAIIGGSPARFRPFVDLHKRAHDQMGTPVQQIGVHSPGFVAPTDAEARDRYFAGYQVMHANIGRSRGWPPLTRVAFEQEVEHGSMYVGSPETVAKKIASTVKVLGLDRFQLKYSGGPVLAEHALESVQLYGEKVAPMVRDMLA